MNTNTNTTEMNLGEAKARLSNALKMLAGVCNYAASEDGMGFNKFDADFGHKMAELDVRYWSPKQTAAAYKICRKYGKQLSGRGIDLSMLPDISSWETVAAMHPAPAPAQSAPAPATEAAAPAPQQNGRKITYLPRGFMRVEFPYDAAIVGIIKSMPWKMRKWEGGDKCWLVNFVQGSPEEIGSGASIFSKMAVNSGFAFPDDFLAKMAEYVAGAISGVEAAGQNHDDSFATDAELTHDDLEWIGGQPMPFQRAGIKYAIRNRRVIIGDEMGLGKTPQSLVAVELADAFPMLVVCRASLKTNWTREARKWLGARRTISGNCYDKADITILTHAEVIEHQDFLADERKFKSLVGDESQDFKNHKAKRTVAVKRIADGMEKEAMVLLLSGTPIMNRPVEFVSQLNIIGRMQQMGGWKKFTTRYCDAKQTRFGMDLSGASNLDELNAKLRQTCYIRRLKKDVLTELPDKRREVISIELSNAAAYERAQEDVAARLVEMVNKARVATGQIMQKVNSMRFAEVITFIESEFPSAPKTTVLKMEEKGEIDGRIMAVRFIQQALADRESGVENSGALTLISELRVRAAEGKLAGMVKWAQDFQEDTGEKFILFARSREAQAQLAKQIPNAIWTRDTTRFENSQAAVDLFMKDDSIKTLICSLEGDNAGLNITCASYVGFFERAWVPSVHDQAEDRAHRIGQKNSVNCYYFDAPGTVDETLAAVQEIKRDIIQQAANGGKSAQGAVVKELIAAIMRGGKVEVEEAA